MERVEHKRLRNTFYILLLVVLASLLAVTVVSAQEIDTSGITDDQVNAIAKDLFCPVCENVPLDVCGTQACAQWRELIREKLAEGWTDEEIKDYFSAQYGARVLAEPPRSGFNWLVYIIPPVIFLAGAFFLYRGFTIWRNLAHEPEEELELVDEAEAEVQDEYLARLEEELKKQ